MEALRYFYRKTRNRISFEYIAFQNFNDRAEDAARLAAVLYFPVFGSWSALSNTTRSTGRPSSSGGNRIDDFAKYLRDQG